MKTWIMLIDPLRVSVFKADIPKKALCFSTVIKNNKKMISSSDVQHLSKEFARYVAEEIEIACGCGSDSSLIICGDSKDLKKVCDCLSQEAKKCILGIGPKGYHPELWVNMVCHANPDSVNPNSVDPGASKKLYGESYQAIP